MPKSAPNVSFETQLQELEQLVKQLEDSQLPLADSMASFERGVELSRHCQALLEQAELKIQELMKADDETQGPAE